jgi:hypothetical protein
VENVDKGVSSSRRTLFTTLHINSQWEALSSHSANSKQNGDKTCEKDIYINCSDGVDSRGPMKHLLSIQSQHSRKFAKAWRMKTTE